MAAAGAATATAAAVEGPFQAVAQGVVQGDFDDAGLDQHLGGGDIKAFEGGFDAFVFGAGAPDDDGVVQLVGHDANVPQGGDAANAAVDGLPRVAHAAAQAAACAARQALLVAGCAVAGVEGVQGVGGAAGGGAQAGGYAAGASGAGAGAAEDAGEYVGQVLGVAVLHVVDVQLGLATAAAGLVKLAHPAFDLL